MRNEKGKQVQENILTKEILKHFVIFQVGFQDSVQRNASLDKYDRTEPALVAQHVIGVAIEPEWEPNELQHCQAPAQWPQWRWCNMPFRFVIVNPNLHFIVNV